MKFKTSSPELIKILAKADRIAKQKAKEVREEREWWEKVCRASPVHMPPRGSFKEYPDSHRDNRTSTEPRNQQVYSTRTISCLAYAPRGIGEYRL
jgi:hypothetical protein